MGTAVNSQRFWSWQWRQNLSVRLSSPVDSSLDGQQLADVTVRFLPCCDLQCVTHRHAQSVNFAVITHKYMSCELREAYKTPYTETTTSQACCNAMSMLATSIGKNAHILLWCPHVVVVLGITAANATTVTQRLSFQLHLAVDNSTGM